MRLRVIVRDEDTGVESRPGVVFCNPISHHPLPNLRLPMTIKQGDREWTIDDPDIAEMVNLIPVTVRAVQAASREKKAE